MTAYNKKYIYAVYKGNEYICDGTKAEICQRLNIKPATLDFYCSNWYLKNRESKKNNRIIITRVE